MSALRAVPSPGPDPAESRAELAWAVELDRLELDLLRVERLLKAVSPFDDPGWTEPNLDVPLPESLLPRAMDIHARQARLLHDVVRALARSTRQRTFADHVAESTTDVRGPAYVDLST